MQRRTFLASSLVLPAAVASTAPLTSTVPRGRGHTKHAGKFKISLKANAIGVDGTAEELLESAIKHGYEALSVPAQGIEGWDVKRKQSFVGKALANGIVWGASGLPVEFRESEERFKKDLTALSVHAQNLSDIGVTRIGTWLISGSDTMTYNENMKFHADRLRECAKVLGEKNIKLGLEYLGTPSIRHKARFAWLSTGRELKELIAMIGEPNVGVILDSYHWHTAQETAEDLMIWSNDEIVAVDLNDANAQLALNDQTDIARELPGATGVIDLNAFLQPLVEIGYDGPLRAEPFSTTLNAMSNELALAATFDAVHGAVTEVLGAGN
ncbi:MAG: TIM barrel protein [Lewinella sp.]|nr:TIM barrel protein [Lewinella sp.]